MTMKQKPRQFRRFIALAWYLVILVRCNSVLGQPRQDAADKILLGYVHGMPPDINYELYTHLCHAFVVADKDGTLLPRRNVPNRDLTRRAHESGVKVLLSLGGWGWDANFQAMTLDPQAEDRYVNVVLDIVKEFDYDGIDLDWEYPDTNIEIVSFERLARRFRTRLDDLGDRKNSTMLLTMAASAHPKTLEWLAKDFLLETMDWINVMTYDYCGTWATFAGHHAPLFSSSKVPAGSQQSVEQTIHYLVHTRGLLAERLLLGIPLYGRVFAVSDPYASTANAPKPRRDAVNYKQIAQLINDDHWTRTWDDETKNPWLLAPDRSEVICYDDVESVANKVQWSKAQGLRGVFFWQIDADQMSDGSNPLQEAARERLFQVKH